MPQDYYYTATDITIPGEVSNKNVILTLKGMRELSTYYLEKYNIKIVPLEVKMSLDNETASQVLYAEITKIKTTLTDHGDLIYGFILHNKMAGKHGHSMPVIWEKV